MCAKGIGLTSGLQGRRPDLSRTKDCKLIAANQLGPKPCYVFCIAWPQAMIMPLCHCYFQKAKVPYASVTIVFKYSLSSSGTPRRITRFSAPRGRLAQHEKSCTHITLKIIIQEKCQHAIRLLDCDGIPFLLAKVDVTQQAQVSEPSLCLQMRSQCAAGHEKSKVHPETNLSIAPLEKLGSSRYTCKLENF